MVFIHATVCQYQNVDTISVCLVHFYEQTVNGTIQTGAFIIGNRNFCYLEAIHFHMLDFQHIGVGQDWVIDFQYLTVFRLFLQKVPVFSNVYGSGCNHLFTDSINWRIGYLCEKLFEIVEQWLLLVR